MPITNVCEEETGEQTAEMVCVESLLKQSRMKKPSRQVNYYYRKTTNKEKIEEI